MRLVLNHSEACETIQVGGKFTFVLAERLINLYEKAQAYVGFDFFLVDEPNDCVWVFEDEWVKYVDDF